MCLFLNLTLNTLRLVKVVTVAFWLLVVERVRCFVVDLWIGPDDCFDQFSGL